MLKSHKKLSGMLSPLETDESFHTPKYSFKARSTSTRHFSPYQVSNKGNRQENLSIVRTPSAVDVKKGIKTPTRKHTSQKRISNRINSRLLSVNREKHSNYFFACRTALQELIRSNIPLSEALQSIQNGYEDHILLQNNEIKRCQDLIEKHETDKKVETLRNTSGPLSIFERTKGRKRSKNALKSVKKLESSDFPNLVSVPRLNIMRLAIHKQESNEKITNTRDDTAKNVVFQDYQDEFMSKFDEFSESWRLQILEKKTSD